MCVPHILQPTFPFLGLLLEGISERGARNGEGLCRGDTSETSRQQHQHISPLLAKPQMLHLPLYSFCLVVELNVSHCTEVVRITVRLLDVRAHVDSNLFIYPGVRGTAYCLSITHLTNTGTLSRDMCVVCLTSEEALSSRTSKP